MTLPQRLLSRRPVQDGLLIAVATALSMVRTGALFPRINNHFHLPIVLDLHDQPIFADSAFIQSMRHYASGFWWVLGGVWDGQNAEAVFLALFVASRALFFGACLAWAGLLGIAGPRQRAGFLVLLVFSPLLNGYSSAGTGGLLIDYFSQSELANAPLLLSIALAARRRFAPAIAVSGLTFFLNAFVAVWGFVPILGCMLWHLASRQVTLAATARQILLGSAVFIVLAAPVIRMILANPDFGRPIDFDFRDYLSFYYPNHFLIAGVPRRQILVLAIMAAAGLLAVGALRQRHRGAIFCGIALLGFILVWCIGVVLPFLTGSPLLLNLHLLRAGSGIQLASALALAALLVSWLDATAPERQRSWAPALAIASETLRNALPLLLIIIPLSSRVTLPRSILGVKLELVAGLLIVFLFWPWQILDGRRALRAAEADIATWNAVAAWSRRNTPETAVFLVPVGFGDPPNQDPSAPDAILREPVAFEALAGRRVWVDFRSGAAVLWTPSFHRLWRQRVTEVMSLPDRAARLGYARAHGIDYLVDTCGDALRAVFRSGPACVYAVAE